eukprot:Rmarinus@m.22198
MTVLAGRRKRRISSQNRRVVPLLRAVAWARKMAETERDRGENVVTRRMVSSLRHRRVRAKSVTTPQMIMATAAAVEGTADTARLKPAKMPKKRIGMDRTLGPTTMTTVVTGMKMNGAGPTATVTAISSVTTGISLRGKTVAVTEIEIMTVVATVVGGVTVVTVVTKNVMAKAIPPDVIVIGTATVTLSVRSTVTDVAIRTAIGTGNAKGRVAEGTKAGGGAAKHPVAPPARRRTKIKG